MQISKTVLRDCWDSQHNYAIQEFDICTFSIDQSNSPMTLNLISVVSEDSLFRVLTHCSKDATLKTDDDDATINSHTTKFRLRLIRFSEKNAHFLDATDLLTHCLFKMTHPGEIAQFTVQFDRENGGQGDSKLSRCYSFTIELLECTKPHGVLAIHPLSTDKHDDENEKTEITNEEEKEKIAAQHNSAALTSWKPQDCIEISSELRASGSHAFANYKSCVTSPIIPVVINNHKAAAAGGEEEERGETQRDEFAHLEVAMRRYSRAVRLNEIYLGVWFQCSVIDAKDAADKKRDAKVTQEQSSDSSTSVQEERSEAAAAAMSAEMTSSSLHMSAVTNEMIEVWSNVILLDQMRLYRNIAICQIKVKSYNFAVENCNRALENCEMLLENAAEWEATKTVTSQSEREGESGEAKEMTSCQAMPSREQLQQERTKTQFQRGIALFQLGKMEECARDLRSVAKSFPKLETAHNLLRQAERVLSDSDQKLGERLKKIFS